MMQPFNATLLHLLKNTGYTHTNTRALDIFSSISLQYIDEFLKTLANTTNHAQRSKTTVVDLFAILNLSKIDLNNKGDVDFKKVVPLGFETDANDLSGACTFENSIVSKIDRYIHIYEFMPSFPPTHTFKKTFPKETIRNETPEKIKTRLEQVARAEKNLIKMLRVSKGLPKYVNFMDTMK